MNEIKKIVAKMEKYIIYKEQVVKAVGVCDSPKSIEKNKF